jgi:hypothetical protein
MIGGAPIFMPAPVYAQAPMVYPPQGYPAGGQLPGSFSRPVAVEARPPAVGGSAPVFRGAMGNEPTRQAQRRIPPAIPTPEELHVRAPGSATTARAVAARSAPVVPTPEELGVSPPNGPPVARVAQESSGR